MLAGTALARAASTSAGSRQKNDVRSKCETRTCHLFAPGAGFIGAANSRRHIRVERIGIASNNAAPPENRTGVVSPYGKSPRHICPASVNHATPKSPNEK